MTEFYDVVIVGGRCAGASTGRLLAQAGLNVAIVDRARFPSDTISTHAITTGGSLLLQRWGLFDRVLATNTPHVRDMTVTIGPRELTNPMALGEGWPGTTAPRRIVLDQLLLDAATEAGATVREEFSVDHVLVEDGVAVGIAGRDRDGTATELRASLTIGADGTNSIVARSVGAPEYRQRDSLGAGFYSYFSGWPGTALELAFIESAGVGVVPTNDEQVCVFAAAPADQFGAYKRDVEATHRALVASVSPRLGEWFAGTQREERFYGWPPSLGFFRQPYGPGWALVGDAGYHKDMITAHGITDAFRDAQLLADAVRDAFVAGQPLHEGLEGYRDRRDELSIDMYEATQDIAQFDKPPSGIAKAFLRFASAEQKEWAELAAARSGQSG